MHERAISVASLKFVNAPSLSNDQTEDSVPGYRYDAQLASRIEEDWQQRWVADGTYRVAEAAGADADEAFRPKLFVMDMFPYPSGSGLHVGHPLGSVSYTHLTLPTKRIV